MPGDFGRELGRMVEKEAERLISDIQGGAQRDLDALLNRAPSLDLSVVRSEVAALFKRHGFDAPLSEIEHCATGLVAGERVVLSWNGRLD